MRPNATLEIAESNAMLNGQINLYGGTLKIDDNVSVVSNGTEMAGVYIGLKRYTTASLVIGEKAELDIRAINTALGCKFEITAPESARVRLLSDVYIPEKADQTISKLSAITYNGKMATMGDDYVLKGIDDDTYFDIGNEVVLKDGSVTPAAKQTKWLNCGIDIADDHALLRRGLATLLGFNKGISVIGDAMNGEEAVKAAIELKPDAIRRKLGAHNRAETVAIAFRKQLLTV